MNNTVTEALRSLSLDYSWPDEIAGESEYHGWHALFSVDATLYEALAQAEDIDPEDFTEFVAAAYSKVIVVIDSDGHVTRHSFKSEDESEAYRMMVEAGEYVCESGHVFYSGEDGCEQCKGEEDAELVQ